MNMDLHSLYSDGTSGHDNCRDWCDNNATCGAFTVVFSNKCFFKNMSCGNDITNGLNTVLYLKQGGFE